MSPELETLDQLLGGSLPLPVIRGLFDDDGRFVGAVTAMLDAGEVRLLAGDGYEVPRWQWRELLADRGEQTVARLDITRAGARRIV
jgi:hypothetical protein